MFNIVVESSLLWWLSLFFCSRQPMGKKWTSQLLVFLILNKLRKNVHFFLYPFFLRKTFHIFLTCTDLDSLIEIFHCRHFLQLWFYVKSILVDFRRSKTAVLTILEALNFDFWKNFTLENVKSPQIFKIQSCWNGQNGSFWGSKWPNLISRKIWSA